MLCWGIFQANSLSWNSKPLTGAADWRQPITSALLIYSILCLYLICLSWVKLVYGVGERILTVKNIHLKVMSKEMSTLLSSKKQTKKKTIFCLIYLIIYLKSKAHWDCLKSLIISSTYYLCIFFKISLKSNVVLCCDCPHR